MAAYKVLIDDNYHFTDEDERVTHGIFASAEEALAACKSIVDECLAPMYKPGMTAVALYEQYTHFGDDPFIAFVGQDDAPVTFSAWDYARERCGVIAGRIEEAK